MPRIPLDDDEQDRTDRETLLAGTQDERDAAMERLLERSYPRSIRRVIRETGCVDDAPEVVNSTYVRFWNWRANYDPTRPFWPVLSRFLFFASVDYLRNRKHMPRLVSIDQERQNNDKYDLPALQPSILDDLVRQPDKENLAPFLDQCVDELEPGLRNILCMRYLEAQQVTQIARKLGIAKATVNYRVHKALQQLHARLLKKFEEQGERSHVVRKK